MAVQARHLNPFPPPSLCPDNNNFVYRNEEVAHALDSTACSVLSGHQLIRSTNPPVLDSNLWMHNIYHTNNASPWTPSLKAESGITYADNWGLPVASRKRSRRGYVGTTLKYGIHGEEDLSSQIRRNQLDVDRIISQHVEKVKMYIEEKSKREMRKWGEAVEKQIAKREEEIERIGKLNWALEERIKSMCVESQIWKDVASANEATANALRRNLEEALLSQTRDAEESSCGSNVNVREVEERRWCKVCGKGEARVVALPCRHLSMCGACCSSTHVCPVCTSPKTASVVVNF